MIKITTETLYNSIEALKEIAAIKLDVRLAYKLSLFIKEVEDRLAVADSVKNKLLTEYGDKNEQGQYYVNMESKNKDVFYKEFSELLLMEIEFDEEPFLTLDSLSDPINKVKASTLLSLNWLIKVL
jgi:hypothetical protein